nr:hypothetical protein [Tanacetum cinerariifolium]
MCTRKVSEPTTLEEAFSIARIMEARFETIAGKMLNTEEKINIILSCPSEEAPPEIKGSLDANKDIGVVQVSSEIDDVFDIGESNVESMKVRTCGVGEDKLNRVISALKDGGGEFDGRLDEINLNLSEELADNEVSPIPTSLVAYESPRVRQLWERIGSGRRKRKKVLVEVAEGRRTTVVEDETVVGLGYGIPESREFSRHHFKDKLVVKEWVMIHPCNRTQTEPPPLAADSGCHDGSVVITMVLRRFDCGGGSVDGGVEVVGCGGVVNRRRRCRQWGSGEVVAAEAVVAVAARGVVGRIDRETRSLFGVRRKNLQRLPEAATGRRGGAWCGGSDRSGDAESFWCSPEKSPAAAGGGDWPAVVVAAGGCWGEGE